MAIAWFVGEWFVSNCAKEAHVVSRQKQEVSTIEDISPAVADSTSVRNHIARLSRPDARIRCDRRLENWEGYQSYLELRGVDACQEQE
jgi:hypothetical protein